MNGLSSGFDWGIPSDVLIGSVLFEFERVLDIDISEFEATLNEVLANSIKLEQNGMWSDINFYKKGIPKGFPQSAQSYMRYIFQYLHWMKRKLTNIDNCI